MNASAAAVVKPGMLTADPRAAVLARTLPTWLEWIRTPVRVRHVLVLVAALLYPAVASPFFTFQIGGQSLALGVIALSISFLAGYGGMVSLSQMTVAGIAGYSMAIFSMSSVTQISMGWPWWIALILALAIATITAALIGLISARTDGIYTIMITLAIGMVFYYFAQQNYALLNGFQGFPQVLPPEVFGIDWREPAPYYYLALACALAGYLFVKHLVRTPFGIALQGVRDNPRRMLALGFNVTAYQVVAHAVAGLVAAVGGVLYVWYATRISPGTIGIAALVNVLVIAVIGGMRHPIGAFIGALTFVLLQNFAIDLVSRERFNLVIGGIFLAIVLFSPDGMLGLWDRLRRWNSGAGTSRH
jgi:branched-chain amino acid transport system permease protein